MRAGTGHRGSGDRSRCGYGRTNRWFGLPLHVDRMSCTPFVAYPLSVRHLPDSGLRSWLCAYADHSWAPVPLQWYRLISVPFAPPDSRTSMHPPSVVRLIVPPEWVNTPGATVKFWALVPLQV